MEHACAHARAHAHVATESVGKAYAQISEAAALLESNLTQQAVRDKLFEVQKRYRAVGYWGTRA